MKTFNPPIIFIHLSIQPSIHPSIIWVDNYHTIKDNQHPTIQPHPHPFIHTFNHPSNHSSIRLFTYPSIYGFIIKDIHHQCYLSYLLIWILMDFHIFSSGIWIVFDLTVYDNTNGILILFMLSNLFNMWKWSVEST